MKYLVQHFIESSLESRANEVAVQQGDRQVTYAELDEMAKRFACLLAEKRSASPMIGILSRVRVETIALMIAALRQGVVYVPLNIHAPVEWIGSVVRSAGITDLWVDEAFEDRAEALHEWGIRDHFVLSEKLRPLEGIVAADLADAPKLADDLAYILYTSGSTGDPKGIMITHRNAYTFIDWMHEAFEVKTSDRIFSRAPLQFDLSVFDIFTTLAAGATLVIADLGFDNRQDSIVQLMKDEKITIVYTVPSAYIAWLTKGSLDRGVPTLRWALYAGEAFPVPYLRRVMSALPGTAFSNIYGPTETNIVTFHHLYSVPTTDDPIPIGKPVKDTEAYIVNERLEQLPPGEIGEILIRGGTVFAGYFNRPELTKERLIQSPFHSYPTLCCRTGDYGSILPDGSIAYHGRRDSMIKTRGYRVEIGEVEAALSAFDGVDEVAVIAKAHERYANTLHAFVGCGKKSVDAQQLKAYVEQKLPSYMVPYEFVIRNELPKTATGKIDRVGLSKDLMN